METIQDMENLNQNIFQNEKDSRIKIEKMDNENKNNNYSKLSTTNKVNLVPPDGGWGWVIVFGGFITMVLGSFPTFSFSILYSPLLMSSGVSSTTTAWIFTLHGLIWSIFTLFIGPICEEYGWRKISLFGGVLNFLSIFLSAFIDKAEYLFITFSVFGGIGGSVSYIVCNIAVSRYFKKRLGFALALITLGGTVSSFLSPLLAIYLLEEYGFIGASCIYAAVVLNQCVGGVLFQPVEWHMKLNKNALLSDNNLNDVLIKDVEEKDDKFINETPLHKSRKESVISAISVDSFAYSLNNLHANVKEDHTDLLDKSIHRQLKKIFKLSYENLKTIKYLRVKLISVGYAFLILGYINFQMWIPFVIINAGYSLEFAAWCVSISSITNVIGRIIMSVLSDRKWFNVQYGYMFGVLLIGLSVIVFSFAQSLELFISSVICWGLGVGIALSLTSTVMINVMGVKMLPAVLGVASLIYGLISIVVGPIVGFIRESSSSYTFALSLLGWLELVGFCLWLLMPFAARYDQNKLTKETVCYNEK